MQLSGMTRLWGVFALAVAQMGLGQAASFSFYSSSRNRTYTFQTDAVGTVVPFGGHGIYSPAAISPSAQTNNLWVLLFTANEVAGQDGRSGLGVYMSTSSSPTSGFSTPTEILSVGSLSNICDIAATRAIYVDSVSRWYVFVQALEGSLPTGCSYPGGSLGRGAIVIAATGPALNQLQWIVDPGTSNATALLYTTRPCPPGNGACGIGQNYQLFNTVSDGGPSWIPLLTVYNDWSYTSGGQQFGYLTDAPEGPWYYWYSVGGAWAPPGGTPFSLGVPNPYRGLTLQFPDAVLSNSLDAASLGNPGFAVGSGCDTRSSSGPYNYGTGIGFFDQPVPMLGAASDGIAVFGDLASTNSDSYGPRMFEPRLARNAHGYIAPSSLSPRQWTTYLYYNDAQTGDSSNKCGYPRWWSSDQRFAVSLVTITEQ